MTTEPSDWGIPDWSDPNAYPSDIASVNLFYWQFLRRREDYRKDWFALLEQGDAECLCYRGNWVDDNDPRSKEPRNSPNWTSVVAPGELCEKYCLAHLPDPRATKPVNLHVEHDVPLFILPNDDDEKLKLLLQPNKSCVVFDLDEPINYQIERAKYWLQIHQVERQGKIITHRKEKRNWRRLLRVLDGRAAGETYEAIGQLLYIDEELSENLTQAQCDRILEKNAAQIAASAEKQALRLSLHFPL
jgi:hypothetical protein